MDHYYSHDPSSQHNPGQVEITVQERTFVFHTDSGVFSRGRVDYGSSVLIEAMPPVTGRLLDLGCGYGPIGLTLAALNPGLDAVLVDINRRALELATRNAKALNIPAMVLESDGFSAVTGEFDVIVTNPPIRAGKSVFFPWFDQAPQFLRACGLFVCVIQKRQGAPTAIRALEASFGNAEVIERSAGFWVICSRKG